MMIEQRAVPLLRFFLVVLFALLVMLQSFSLPGQFASMAEESPDMAYLRWPLTAVAVFLMACAQAVVVSTWQLLTLVKNDRIFSPASLAWVDAIVWAVAAAWVVLGGLSLYVVVNADDPGTPILLFLMMVGLSVLGLLMVVIRALLRQATALRTDMEAVI